MGWGVVHVLGIASFLILFAHAEASAASETATGGELKNVEKALDQGKKRRDALKKKSAGLSRDLGGLKKQLVSLAASVQKQETEILRLEDSLAELAVRERDKQEHLGAQRERLGSVLMALQKIARYPPEALLVSPMSPSDTVRGAILLRAAVPAIEDRASVLRQDLSSLAHAREQAAERRIQLAAAQTELKTRRRSLDSLLTEKTRLKKKTDARAREAEKRIRTLARKAKNLRDLMARLEADRIKRQQQEQQKKKKEKAKTSKAPSPSIRKARGTLPYPVVGRLVGRYGQAMETGMTRKGITIETGPSAQVIVPHDGTVVFAGEFKGYGQLLIIEHGEGYHSLLAGLARIDSVTGQRVVSGEPAGMMGNSNTGPPVLYVELRRKGQPINPLPWLAARKIKVNG